MNTQEKKIQILHILSSINLFGGTPRKIFWLAKESKHKHYIFYSGDKKKDFEYEKNKKTLIENHINFIDPINKISLLKQIVFLNQYIKKNKIEVIQCNFNYDYILGAIIKTLNPKLKFITTFVGSESPSSKFKNTIIELFLFFSNYNIFISEYVKTSKLKTYRTLLRKQNKIIYNGTTVNNIIVSEKHKTINQRIEITSIGGLNNYKNLFVLIDSIYIIKTIFKKDIMLNIIGDGYLRKDLENKILDLGIDNYVKIWGYQKDIYYFLENSDIYVHSADKEGFGISVIEAMSVKLPVILANAGALPELIINNQSGLLAEPYNPEDWAKKIVYLAENISERIRLGINGQRRVIDCFSLDKYIKSYEFVYEQLVWQKNCKGF